MATVFIRFSQRDSMNLTRPTLQCDHLGANGEGYLCPDTVEKVAVFHAFGSEWDFFGPLFHAGLGTSLASLRRFWAVAAIRNSSLAPFGPLRRNRSSLSMRLRWANSISTFLRA